VEVQKMNDASPRFTKGQAGAAPLLSSEEGNLRLAALAEHAVELNAWITEEGLRGAAAGELFDGYCQRLSATDIVIMRAYVSTQTLHPQWTGYGYTWRRELKSVREQQFARGPISQEWLSSPFNALIQRSLAGEKNPWLPAGWNSAQSNETFPRS
jgi:adenylate cyclase